MNERIKKMYEETNRACKKNEEMGFLNQLSLLLYNYVGLNDKGQYVIPNSMKDNKLVKGLGGIVRATVLLNEDKEQREQEVIIMREKIKDEKQEGCEVDDNYNDIRFAIVSSENRILTAEEKEQMQKQRDEFIKEMKVISQDDGLREKYLQFVKRLQYERWFKRYGRTTKHFVTW